MSPSLVLSPGAELSPQRRFQQGSQNTSLPSTVDPAGNRLPSASDDESVAALGSMAFATGDTASSESSVSSADMRAADELGDARGTANRFIRQECDLE